MTREDAILHMILRREELKHSVGDLDEDIEAFDMAIEALEQEPKTGHWIEEDMFDGDVAYRCSECNELFWIESGTPKDNEYNFCPKCGARMEVEE